MESCYRNLEKNNYIICIPSRGRSHFINKRQGVWKYLFNPPFDKYNYPLHLFVTKDEEEVYKNSIDNIDSTYSKFILIYTVDKNMSIADKRQYMYSVAVDLDKEFLFIIDDDIVLYMRDETVSSNYRSKFDVVKHKDIWNRVLLESICLCNPKYPITGLPLKQSSNSAKYTFEKNKQLLHMQCYHVPTIIKESINHNDLGTMFMSDRYIQMEMMSRGYNTLANYRFCIDDTGTNTKGGCSITRNPKEQSDSAIELHKRFPGIVKLKTKYDGHWREPRLDCNIFLKKFLKKDEEHFLPKEIGFELLNNGGINYEV